MKSAVRAALESKVYGKHRFYSTRYSQAITCLATEDINSALVPAKRIRINVSGNIFETFESTLARYPDTLLGCPERRNFFFDSKREEYFFSRNRNAFDAILFYYQSCGILHCPANVRMAEFVDELIYFEFGEELVIKFLQHEGVQFSFETPPPANEEIELPENKILRTLWQCFEEPKSSTAAKIVAWWSIGFILLSIFVLCAETIPRQDNGGGERGHNSTQQQSEQYYHLYNCLEMACVSWFTVELLIRFVSAPNKVKFAVDFLNVIDVAAILPFYLALILGKHRTSSTVFKAFRLLRVCRIFKLLRHSSGLKVLSKTIKATWRELLMIIFFVTISTVMLSGVLYYSESQAQKDSFSSIPATFWFVIISLTNVGYGDMVPITIPGRLFGSMCALVGVLVLALPSPVIATKFKLYYEEAKRDRMKKKSSPRKLSQLQC